MEEMTIGQVAGRTGVGVEAIRFYERRGLIPEPPRTSSGYRQYPVETLERLHFIRKAKALSFSLAEIRALIALQRDAGARAAEVRSRTLEKLRSIDEKIRDLRRMRADLTELMTTCTGRGTTEECAILGALASEADPP